MLIIVLLQFFFNVLLFVSKLFFVSLQIFNKFLTFQEDLFYSNKFKIICAKSFYQLQQLGTY